MRSVTVLSSCVHGTHREAHDGWVDGWTIGMAMDVFALLIQHGWADAELVSASLG